MGIQTPARGESQPWNWVERASAHPCKSGRLFRNLTPRRKSRAKPARFEKKIENKRHWAYAAPLNALKIRSLAAIALCGPAVAYGSAVNAIPFNVFINRGSC
jgi:hypothetical protein